MATSKVPAILVPKIWHRAVWMEAKKQSYFEKFTGEDENSIIHRVTDLEKSKGDTVIFGLLMDLSGEGVDGDNTLEGNEEEMVFYDMEVKVNQKRHGVRIEGLLAEQKSPYPMRSKAKNLLGRWMAGYVDKLTFKRLTDAPSANRVVYAGGKAAENQITDTDVITTSLIEKIKRMATNATPKIRPVMIKGKPHYVWVCRDYQLRDLRNDERWMNAQLQANLKGENNPIFSGAEGIWDGVVIHTHENVPITKTGATGANVAHSLFLGAQAAVHAVAKKVYWREKAFDYDNQQGFATGIIHGIAKSKFNDEDFGVINVLTGAKFD